MIRFFYNLLFPLALVLFLPGYVVKMLRRGNYRNKFGQRLGFYDRKTRAKLAHGHATWLHAVSVGEVVIALKLATKMQERDPSLHVALTTTTTTGFALASRRTPDWIEVLYTPLDFWPIMRRAFDVIRPDRIILVEAEVWPNLTALAHHREIPLALVNARLSPRSEGRFRKFNFFVRPYFRKLNLICVQEPEDAARWRSLGVNPDADSSRREHQIRSGKRRAASGDAARAFWTGSGSPRSDRSFSAAARTPAKKRSWPQPFSNCAGNFPHSISLSRRAMWSARGKSHTNFAHSAFPLRGEASRTTAD